ncbi:GAF domain-containing protein [Litchfieldia salsa]|nr:GAF domain-containing protein [Litchfieldia salsa]
MEQLNVYINEQLNEIRHKTSSDFSALACLYKESFAIQWTYVSGNHNERYKSMQGRPGKGLAGLVIRADRLMILDDSVLDLQTKRLEYPIMLAENLQAAVAVPVKFNGQTRGVLLTGSRTRKIYTEQDINWILQMASKIGSTNQTLNQQSG